MLPQKDSARSDSGPDDHTSMEESFLVSCNSLPSSRFSNHASKKFPTPPSTRHTSEPIVCAHTKSRGDCMANFRAKQQTMVFLRKYQTFSLPRGERNLPANMNVPGKTGVAGVIRYRLILFQQLEKLIF